MKHTNLIELLLSLPLSFSSWNGGSDYVYISNSMRELLKLSANVIDSYNFIKAVDRTFGKFLIIAAEKVLISGKYTETKENNTITLLYNNDRDSYLLYIQNKEDNKQNGTLEYILNCLPVYVWQRDADLKMKYCNKKYADALETTTANVIDANLKLPLTTELKESSLEQLAIVSGKPQNSKRHVIVNGCRKFLDFTELPINSRGQQIGYALDISEEEEIIKEYEIFKRQTHETFNHISVPIAIFDDKTNLIFTNNAMLKLFELEESYISSSPTFTQILDKLMEERKLMDVDDYPKFKQKILNYFREIVEPYHTFTHISSGRALNVMISPNYGGGLIFVCEDITEKLTIEREYNALSAVQKETLEHLYEGILVFGADNRVRMINQSTRIIWNINEKKNVSGKHIKEFFKETSDLFLSSDERESWISLVINMGEQRKECNGIIAFKESINIDYAYVPLPDGMNLIRFVDVTDKSKLEEALEEKEDTMQQIYKLKSNFISNISYELKSPINTITGFSDILLNQYFGDLNDKQKEYCTSIVASANKLSEMIDALLNLSSMEAGESRMLYSEVKIANMFTEVENIFSENVMNKGLILTTTVDTSHDSIYIDEASTKQVLLQVFSLAIKNTQIGGSMFLSATDTPNIPNYVDITIKHTGIGMSEEQLVQKRAILNPGETDENIPSTYSDFLLTLASHVAKRHNGKIIIDSKQNEHTEIIIRIPIQPLAL